MLWDMPLDSGLCICAQFTRAHICGVSPLCNACSQMCTDHIYIQMATFPKNRHDLCVQACTQFVHTHGSMHVHISKDVPFQTVCIGLMLLSVDIHQDTHVHLWRHVLMCLSPEKGLLHIDV